MEEEGLMSALPTHILWTGPRPSAASAEPVDAGAVADISAVTIWQKREAELLAIRRLKDDWDGFGADAPNPKLVDTAITFLHALRSRDGQDPPMRVTLSPDGLIALEWQKGKHFLRAEVGSYTEVEWMRVTSGGSAQFSTERLPSVAKGEQAWPPSTSIAAGGVVLDFVL